MTAREYCKSHPVTAYDSSYGRCGGFQIHGDIEYGIDDYLYGMSGVLCDDEKYFHYHHAIQEIVNPSRGQAEAKVTIYGDGKDRAYTLREGDRVIINKNNYELHTCISCFF